MYLDVLPYINWMVLIEPSRHLPVARVKRRQSIKNLIKVRGSDTGLFGVANSTGERWGPLSGILLRFVGAWGAGGAVRRLTLL